MATYPKDNAPLHDNRADPGKGRPVIPPNNGDLIGPGFDPSEVRGDSHTMGDAGSRTGMQMAATLGMSVDPDAVNSLGGFDAKSDPAFDCFNREDRGGFEANEMTGSESPESVSSERLIEGGGQSDSAFDELPDEQQLGQGAKPMDEDDKPGYRSPKL